MGILLGVLVQLHYPNTFLIAPFLVILALKLKSRKRKDVRLIIQWIIFSIIGFVITLSPFIMYEFQHGSKDIKELVAVIFLSNSYNSFSQIAHNILNLTTLSFKNLISLGQSLYSFIIQLLIISLPFMKRCFCTFFTLWFIGGVAILSFYNGNIVAHYLNFIIPISFFLLGYFIKTAKDLHWSMKYSISTMSRVSKTICTVFVASLLFLNFSGTDIFFKRQQ